MAVTESSEVVIEAPADEVLDVMLDLESLPEWSDAHQTSEVLERDSRGRPLRSRATIRTAGITDEQVIEFTYHDDGYSWSLVSAKYQRAQNARYTVIPEGDNTRVKFQITIEPIVPLPGFVLKTVARTVIRAATKGLRRRVLSVKKGR